MNPPTGTSYPQMGFGQSGQYPSQASAYPPPNASPYPPPGPGYPPQTTQYPPSHKPQAGASPYPPPIQATVAYPSGAAQPLLPPTGSSAPIPNAPPSDWKGEILNFDPQIQPPTNPFFVPNFDDPAPYSVTTDYKTRDISEEDARKALEDYVGKKCCYGKPSDISIEEVLMENVFKYELKTTTEMRKTQWKFEGYTNQPIPGPAPVPNAWDMNATQSTQFKDEEKHIEMPGTSSVRPCQKCWGLGNARCHHCQGRGFDNCTWCKGAGYTTSFDERQPCNSCNTTGRKDCTWCHGKGTSMCDQCRGRGQVYTYLDLVVTWKVHKGEFITEENSSAGGEVVPKKKLSKCDGSKVFDDTRERLYPITSFPSQPITEASRRLLESHSKLQTNDILIRQQKHIIEVIRIASVKYKCKGEPGVFRVYGEDNKVFFPDYPHTCCCSII